MGWFSRSPEEVFVAENAEKLVHNLAHHCAAGAKEVTDGLKANVPNQLGTDAIFLFLFSLRATIELEGVRRRFGDRPYRRLLEAVESLYRSTFPEAAARTGAFARSLMRDVLVSIGKSNDPADWIRTHAVRTLQTKDSQHELFHMSLIKVFSNGEPIAAVIERAA
jgi:hypothetical protein